MKLNNYLILILIVLLNIAGTTLFFRIDMTENNSYSLSEASKKLVRELEEPLTIKVFLSENLPVPYNTMERDIRDILLEYKLEANKHFNYTIDIIKKDKEGTANPETYNIFPVNIQNIEQDEVKVVSAYIGMAFIHGDLTETVPAIEYNQNLELIITNKLRTLTEKTTALLSLKEKIKTTLYISPILYQLGSDFKSYPEKAKDSISVLNDDFFNKLEFNFVEPTASEIIKLKEKYSITTLNVEDNSGNTTEAVAVLITENGKDFSATEIIKTDIFGRTIVTNTDELVEEIRGSLDKMIGSKTKIGYLTSNGTIPMSQNQNAMFSGQQQPALNSLNSIISENYAMSVVDLSTGHINSDIKTLIIAKPTIKFTQRELFILDQYLMKGNSVLLAVDQFEMDMEKSNPNYGQEVYKNVDHGLLELLKHYGINVSENMVLDKRAFKQVQRDNNGSIIETQLYFAPLIESGNINTDLPFLKGVNELITFRMAEVSKVSPTDNSVKTLFSSSEESWVQNIDNMTMSPGKIFPPTEKSQYSLAVVKTGNFSSYFNNKSIPTQEYQEATEEQNEESIDPIDSSENFIKDSNKGKLIVLGSSDLLTDSIISNQYPSNALLIQNCLDYLSDREDYTQMRSKGVFHRPMEDTTSLQRNFIKYFNIVGLPLLVAVAGLLVYLFWLKRRKDIDKIFMENENEK